MLVIECDIAENSKGEMAPADDIPLVAVPSIQTPSSALCGRQQQQTPVQHDALHEPGHTKQSEGWEVRRQQRQ